MNDKRLHEFSNPFNFTTKDINIVEVYNRKRLTLRKKKLDENFKQLIINFSKDKLPQIYKLLDKYKDNRNIIIFKSRAEADNYIKKLQVLKQEKLN